MKYGIREVVDVVFKAKSDVKIGSTNFVKGQPVLILDSAKTSTLEGAATTVYAQGGKGNTRLLTWEGEKTLTFTVEDALISPVGMSILTGAGLISNSSDTVYIHQIVKSHANSEGKIDISEGIELKIGGDTGNAIHSSDITVMKVVDDDISGAPVVGSVDSGKIKSTITDSDVIVDFYIETAGNNVDEIQIDANHFAGYYYVEAMTAFKRQADGVDAPVAITLPNVKIQSNFTFTMASSGDPSTFTFTMDAMPGYTKFNSNKKVLCAMQIVKSVADKEDSWATVMSTATE